MSKILLILISSFLLAGCNRLDNHQPLTSQHLSYAKVETISQSFVASENNLNIVSICVRNPSRVLTPFEFTLHVATTSATPVRTLEFSGGNIDNQDCTRFQFDPIPDSKGKSYIGSITAKPETEVRDYYGVYIEADQNILHYKTFYYQPLQATISESLRALSTRLTTKDPVFFIAYFALLIIVLYRLIKR